MLKLTPLLRSAVPQVGIEIYPSSRSNINVSGINKEAKEGRANLVIRDTEQWN